MVTNVKDPSLYSKISSSELYSLNRCKRMWSYSYEQGLVPASTPSYLSDGSFFHMVMARILSYIKENGHLPNIDVLTSNVQVKALEEEEGITVDEPTRLRFVSQITEYFNSVWTLDTRIVAVEQEFYADVGLQNPDGTSLLVHGFLDAVVRDSSGNLWILEHKTASRAWSQQQFEFATQDILYALAWEAVSGEFPTGIQYNFFYPKRWEVKHKFVDKAHTVEVLNDVQASASLRQHIVKGWAPREPLYGCGGCQFRDLCYSELLGADSTYLRTNSFKVDPNRAKRFVEGG